MTPPSRERDWTALPPAMEACDSMFCDSYDEDSDSETVTERKVMMRYSSCKNAFYCSARCQKLAWKADHKENCSAFPQPLPPVKFGEIDPDVSEQFTRVWELMGRIKESWKQAEDSVTGTDSTTQPKKTKYNTEATTELSKMTFPPAFKYSHPSFPPSVEESGFKISKTTSTLSVSL